MLTPVVALVGVVAVVVSLIALASWSFLKKGPIPASFSVYFRLFNMLQFKLKKRRWCAWESNPGRQDGRRKRIH